jgi:hypothetical protein
MLSTFSFFLALLFFSMQTRLEIYKRRRKEKQIKQEGKRDTQGTEKVTESNHELPKQSDQNRSKLVKRKRRK